MVDQRLQGMISLLLRYDLLTSTRLFLQYEQYSAMFLFQCQGEDDFRSVLIHHMLSNVDLTDQCSTPPQ